MTYRQLGEIADRLDSILFLLKDAQDELIMLGDNDSAAVLADIISEKETKRMSIGERINRLLDRAGVA